VVFIVALYHGIFHYLCHFKCDLPRQTVPKTIGTSKNARPSFKSLLTPIRRNAIQSSTQ
jgi:hypothetical protein